MTDRTSADVRREIQETERAAADLVERFRHLQAARPGLLLEATDEALAAHDAEMASTVRSHERAEARRDALKAELPAIKAAEIEAAVQAKRDRLAELAELNERLHRQYSTLADQLVGVLDEMAEVSVEAATLSEDVPHRVRPDVDAFRRGPPNNIYQPRVDEAAVLPGVREGSAAIWPRPAPRPEPVLAAPAPTMRPIAPRDPIYTDGRAGDPGFKIYRVDEEAWHRQREAHLAEERKASTRDQGTGAAFGRLADFGGRGDPLDAV